MCSEVVRHGLTVQVLYPFSERVMSPGLVGTLPVYPILGFQHLGNVDVHELGATREDGSRNHLNAALWQVKRGWF